MEIIINPIDKLEFLLGKWNLCYKIPQSTFSPKGEGTGCGEIKKILNDKYIKFEYQAEINSAKTAAQGIFGWDDKSKIYRYWWFEDSGSFLTATANFVNPETLHMNWHDSLLIQTFAKVDDRMVLTMRHPSAVGYEIILEVIFSRA